MTPYAFHPEAESELQQGIDFYENCSQGLGLDFAMEVYRAIQSIREHPAAWPILEGKVRRCLTSRFPYGVLYSMEADSVFILAIMHLHRQPAYWARRTTKGSRR